MILAAHLPEGGEGKAADGSVRIFQQCGEGGDVLGVPWIELSKQIGGSSAANFDGLILQ